MDEDGIEEKAEEGGIQKLKMRTQKGLSKKKKLKERNNEFADEGKKQKKEKVEAKLHGESKVIQRCFDDNNNDNKR